MVVTYSESFDIIHGQLVASNVEKSILEHASVAVAMADVSDMLQKHFYVE